MSKKLVLIDGHSILNRAFYGVPDLTNSEGTHTNAMYGFLNIMFKILDEEHADYLTVAFDLSAPTFRHKLFEGYKGTRKSMPEELRQQVPLIKEVLKAMNVTIIEKEGYEADDLLGTLAKSGESIGLDVSLISGDRDMLQLATQKVKIRIPKTKKGVTEVEDYNFKEVFELYGVTPTEFIDIKALMGDASDNIPGAPGIGEKTASAIIQKYKSIENAYANIEQITPNKAKTSLSENYEQVQLSKVLATIDTDAPIDYNIDDATFNNLYTKESYELFKKYNFKSLLKKFDSEIVSTEPEVYKQIKILSELSDIENAFSAMEKAEHIGVFFAYEDNQLFGASFTFASKEKLSLYIPIQGFINEGYLIGKIADLSNMIHNKKNKLIFLNLKEQLDVLKDCEFDMLTDVGLAAYLLNPLKESYLFDELGRDYLKLSLPTKADILGKLGFKEAAFVNEEALSKYACLSSYVIYNAWETIEDELKNSNMLELFETIEMPLLFVLYSMQKEGIMVDKEGLKIYGDKLQIRILELEKEIYELSGTEFNINSPKQLGVVLFETLQMPNGKKTKSGYSTAADVLEKLAGEYPIVGKILEYRQLTKLKSTYADGLSSYIGEDGRIHGKFNQTITATGRISSTEPNLQNIPIRMELGREIRKAFIAKPGCVFIDADYSQIELRILAHMSGDIKLIEAYNSEQDIHRITASQVFHVPLEEVSNTQRSNAKAVNFGIIYGISSFGLSQGLSISRKEANEYIEKYFETYPDIKAFINGLVEDAKEKGYSTTIFDRKRPIPELSSSNFMQRAFGERIAMNSPIQGTAADIIKIAMIKVYEALKDNKLKSKLILQIHDELLVETYEDEVDQVKKILKENMLGAAKLLVSLEIDMNEGKNWFEAH
ncbi:DNA polymerase I [[Clostridium] fimetarium]|uniref:DNA polymerase I n=1 Tax=[Clostridium] fimetarium TaxID=99656 RepID=A0A1I0RJ13_9FIRM|nr:DNA polymerase I [[Clostridium] fimetarium]SEW40907.1 DNA polymerase I [[Clostridium] fimetarium]